MVGKICENKELWDELQHELRKHKVFTSLATKEVLNNFLRTRINIQVNDYATKPLLTHVIKVSDTKQKDRKSFVANNLHANKFSSGKIDPLQMQSQYVLPHFDLKNMILGKKLGKGSQSVVYEIESISTKYVDPHCEKQNTQDFTRKNDQDKNHDMMSCNLTCKNQLPKHYAAKFPHHCNDNKKYEENVKELLHESNILSSINHPNIIKIHGTSSIDTSKPICAHFSKPIFLVLDRLSYTLEELLKIWTSKKILSKMQFVRN